MRTMKTVVAAYCYLGKGSDHKVVLISSTTGRWIIPKGQTEKKHHKRAVALMEAWEEAGIMGKVTGKSRSFIIDRGGKAKWVIFPVKVKALEDDWPERKLRKRCMVSPKEAVKRIDNADLGTTVAALAKIYA